MPSMTFADHLAGRDIERREERGRAVAPVVVRPALRRAERHRQHRRRAVEGLDLTLLVDAQDQGPIRGRQIEADDVAHFVDEERVARECEGLTPMRLQAEGAPNAPDRRVTDIELLRQRPRTPVGRVPRRGLQRVGNHLLHLRITEPPRCPGPRLIDQPVEPLLHEALPPTSGRLPRDPQLEESLQVPGLQWPKESKLVSRI